jgi:hypothetical protein
MYYLNEDNNKILTEEEIRRLDFEENLEDLNNNKKNVIEGIINIQSISECLDIALNGDIKDVIDDLNKCWDYNIKKISEFSSLETILRKYFKLKDNLCEEDGKFTENGYIAYEKLINLIQDLGNIIDIDVNNIVTQLDKIEFDI